MATMVQVAKHARVSVSTVSHVLNGTRNVEPATRRRVLEAIEATGYRQDALARALRRSQTDSIGLVISDVGEPAFADMMHGVEHAAAAQGLTLLLANSSEDAHQEEKAVQTLLNRRVDGLILARSADSKSRLLQELETEKTPTVLLDRIFPNLPFDQVGADNRDSMRRLTSHLTMTGHASFVLIAGDIRVPTLRERLDGFLDGLGDAGLNASDQLVLSGSESSGLDIQLREALRNHPPTAILAASTPLAALTLRAIAEAGLSTPRHLAFATFDGFNQPDLFEPRITTVRQPAFDMGFTAVRLLVDRLASPQSSPRTVRLQQQIEYRSSTEEFVPPAAGRGSA